MERKRVKFFTARCKKCIIADVEFNKEDVAIEKIGTEIPAFLFTHLQGKKEATVCSSHEVEVNPPYRGQNVTL